MLGIVSPHVVGFAGLIEVQAVRYVDSDGQQPGVTVSASVQLHQMVAKLSRNPFGHLSRN